MLFKLVATTIPQARAGSWGETRQKTALPGGQQERLVRGILLTLILTRNYCDPFPPTILLSS